MEAENQKKPKCTVEADQELLRRFQNSDEEALIALIESHYGLLKYWVRKAFNWGDRNDVMQEAVIGFWMAAKEFDFSEGDDFHRIARVRVIGTVYKSKAVSPVRRTLYKNYRTVTKAHDELMRRLNRSPTQEELAQETKLSVKQVDNALNVIAAFPFPLEEAGGHFVVEDPSQLPLIEDAINQLTPYEAEVIIRYYFSEPTTDRAIAKALGKSEGAIKMARKRALEKLRDIIYGKGDRKDGI
jgi:RNA polymerase sigma factor (sigma-70 family)